MKINRIALVGIMAVIMLSGCGTTVQKSVIREEKTQETVQNSSSLDVSHLL